MNTQEEPKKERGWTRRQALLAGAAAGLGLMLPWKRGAQEAAAQNPAGFMQALQPSPALTPFVDPLPLPGALTPYKQGSNYDRYRIVVNQFLQQLHRDLPPTVCWGYNGGYPGPTIEARVNRKVFLSVFNDLRSPYFLSVDTTLQGATPYVINNPAVAVHLHGGLVQPEYDGFPMDRFGPGQEFTYEYPNIQEPATIWFHDHSYGVTRLNVYAGMAAFYLLRDATELAMGLPSGEYEVPLAIQDRIFNADGSLFYPNPWALEFWGDTMVVNGKVWPYHVVKRGWYRLRFLNGCSARFLNINFNPAPPAGAMLQIGGDGSMFANPVPIPVAGQTGLLIAPAERADVLVNFGAYAPGTKITVTNDAPTPYPDGGVGPAIPNVLQFRVSRRTGAFQSVPGTLRPLTVLNPAQAVKHRYITLVESPATGKVLINDLEFVEPVTENPKAGTIEVWHFINISPDSHPMHMHHCMFQVLERRPFDTVQYLANYGGAGPVDNPVMPWTGPAVPPDPNEVCWKDTVRANPGEVTSIIMKWGPFKGKYVYHCHILDHEDHEMMRPMIVT